MIYTDEALVRFAASEASILRHPAGIVLDATVGGRVIPRTATMEPVNGTQVSVLVCADGTVERIA